MVRTVMWIVGGVLVATGVLSLFFTFETPYGGDIATTLDRVGWDAVADFTTTPTAALAAICLLLGIPILVGLNATAWKQTGGY
ncbi:MAG: hypothetical protein ACOZNI_02435 [Myxococcota bacterium]